VSTSTEVALPDEDDLTDVRGPGDSVAMITIGGRTYPRRFAPKCYVCQSPHRAYIEDQVYNGYSKASVVRDLESMEPGHLPHPSIESLRTHFEKHSPARQVMQYKLMEERAKQVGKSIDDATDSLVDEYVAARTVVQIGYERIISGEIKPEISDVLAAAKLVQQIEAGASGGIDQEMWVSALTAYFELTTDLIPPDLMQAWRKRMDTHPVLRAIKEKREREEEIVVEHGDIA
jgi:hypothetical protein